MTKITIYQNANEEYLGFRCTGHAGFAEAGEDVVCAGISVLVINTINAMEQLTSTQFQLKENQEEGIIECTFGSDLDNGGILLMDSMILGLKHIQESYGNGYMKLTFKEV